MHPRRGCGLGDLHRHVRVSVHVHALGGVVIEHGSSGDCQRRENIESAVTSMHQMAMRGAHTYRCVCTHTIVIDRYIYQYIYLYICMCFWKDTSTHIGHALASCEPATCRQAEANRSVGLQASWDNNIHSSHSFWTCSRDARADASEAATGAKSWPTVKKHYSRTTIHDERSNIFSLLLTWQHLGQHGCCAFSGLGSVHAVDYNQLLL